MPEGETIPQYDIEYQARNTRESARVRIKTWRRNLEIELIGSESALDELHRLIMLAALRIQVSGAKPAGLPAPSIVPAHPLPHLNILVLRNKKPII
ncbi:MAG: hypothetical protein NTZ96_06320 [Burkholderiales bacterium]|nr:hypothetical protein [Burkholderiales bacterium]